MGIDKFIENFADIFDAPDMVILKPDTEFKKLERWSSIIALSIMAMVDEEYNVKLKGKDLRDCNTLLDLYNKILVYKK